MTANQESRLNMMELVEQCLNQNAPLWQGVTGLNRAVNRLSHLLAQIRSAGGTATRLQGGISRGKNASKEYLADALLPICQAFKALTTDSGDETLRTWGRYNRSALRRLRDGELPLLADQLLEQARHHFAALEPLGLSQAHLDDAAANLGRFREQSGAPRSRSNTRSSNAAELKGLFTQANILLHETLDPLVRLQKRTQPAFVQAYDKARQVVDVASPAAPDAPAA